MTFEEMRKIVVDTLNCEEEKVTMEASLTEDLEADSLDAVELNMALEDACGVSIPDEELANLKTVWATSTTTSPHISEAKKAMNDIRDLFPGGRMRERTFQLKAKAGCRCRLARAAVCGVQAVRPPRRTHPVGKKPLRLPELRLSTCPLAGTTGSVWCWTTAASGNWMLTLPRRMCWISPGLRRETFRRPEQDRAARSRCNGHRPHWRVALRGCRAGQPLSSWAA